MNDATQLVHCEIRVRGHLGQTLLSAFPNLEAVRRGDTTVLAGRLPDQAALFGALAQIEALGLGLLEVRTHPTNEREPRGRELTAERIAHTDTVRRRRDETRLPVEPGSVDSVDAKTGRVVVPSAPGKSSEKTFRDEIQAFFSLDLNLMAVADNEGRILRVNEAARPSFGFERQELEGKLFLDLVHPDDVGVASAVLERVARGGEVRHFASRIRRKDGTYGHVEWQARRHEGHIYALCHDITTLVETQQALASSAERLRAMFDQSPVAICIYDRDLVIVECNSRAADMVGTEGDRLLGFDLESAADQSLSPALRVALGGDVGHYTGTFRSELSGREGWIVARTAPLRAPNGEIEAGMLLVTDMTELKKAEEMLEKLAFTDSLTGLANRALLRDRLNKAIPPATISDQRLAVLALDVSRFRDVMDTFGRSGADRLLQLLGQRLRASVRSQDTVARDAHDHFQALLMRSGQASQISKAVQRILARCNGLWELDGQEFFLTLCAGVAVYPDDGSDADELMQRANQALRKAKAQGPGSVAFFDSEMTSRAGKRLKLEAELRRALRGKQLVVHYQPQVNLESREIEGFEALVRWQHPERGLVPPSEFIPLAEETGLIVELDRLVLRRGCREVKVLSERLHRRFTLAVNLSAAHLCLPELSRTVRQIVSEEGFEPGDLEIEVTETAILRDPGAAEQALGELRREGMLVSLDDFGTGYSSLSHLQRLPISRLKIDRSFVLNVPRDEGACSIVASVIGLAHHLGFGVIAEGVETVAQLEFLKRQRCDAGQGYHFGRPAPIGEWEAVRAQKRHG